MKHFYFKIPLFSTGKVLLCSREEAFQAVMQAEDTWGYCLLPYELTSVTPDSSRGGKISQTRLG